MLNSQISSVSNLICVSLSQTALSQILRSQKVMYKYGFTGNILSKIKNLKMYNTNT